MNSQLSAYLFSVIEAGGNVFDHFYDKKGIALKTRREAIMILQRAYNRPVTARELTDIMYEIGKQQANVHAELTFMEQQGLVIKSGSSVPYGYSVVKDVDTQYMKMIASKKKGSSKPAYVPPVIPKSEPKPPVVIPVDIVGKHVKHKAFGVGTITAIEGTSIAVEFDKVGLKRMGYEFCMEKKMLEFI